MDQHTYSVLDGRLSEIEHQLNIDARSPKKLEPSILSQFAKLQKQLNQLYDSNAELETLNRIITDLKLWNKINEVPSEEYNLDNETPSEDESNITIEMKQQLVLLKYPAIKEAYDNLVQLSTFDIGKLINYMDTSQEKTHNFNDDNYEVLRRKQTIEEITGNFHMLVVKNMIVLEKYLSLMLRENKFWVDIDKRIQEVKQKVANQETNQKLLNKY